MKFRMMMIAGVLCGVSWSSAFAETARETVGASGGVRLGAQLQLVPGAEVTLSGDGGSISADLATAYAVAATLEFPVSPYVSLGLAPRLIAHLKYERDEDEDSFQELDVRARIAGHYRVAPQVELFAALEPGYARLMHEGEEGVNGLAIGGTLGISYDVSPGAFISGEVGYQRTFVDDDSDELSSSLSYPHVGAGAGVRF